MQYLGRNHSEYLSYFWWREHYRVAKAQASDQFFCKLCKKLHDPREPTKVIKDFHVRKKISYFRC